MQDVSDIIGIAIRERMARLTDDESIFTLSTGVKTYVSLQGNRIRFIGDLDREKGNEDTKGHSCLSCGGEIFPRLGSVRSWHFSHKSGAECSPEGAGKLNETLLHNAAKIMLTDMPGVLLEAPIIVQSELFEDIAEIEFPDCFLGYSRAVQERTPEMASGAWRPDVMADLKGWPGRPLLIEVAVTHPVDDEKARQVVEEDFDMIEICLDHVHEATRDGDIEITKGGLRKLLHEEAPRRWVHSRVSRILKNRVFLQETRRRCDQARERFEAASSGLAPILPDIEGILSRREPGLPVLQDWIAREVADERQVLAELEAIQSEFRRARRPGLGAQSLEDLSPDRSFALAERVASRISDMVESRGLIGPLQKDFSTSREAVLELLEGVREDDGDIMGRLSPVLDQAEALCESFCAKVGQAEIALKYLNHLQREAEKVFDDAERGHRLLMESVKQKLADLRSAAGEAVRRASPKGSNDMLPDDIDALALAEIRKGVRTPGAIASTAHLGVTKTYHAVARLIEAGKVLQAPDGSLSAP